ncbi:MAG: nuclear transport factor 2 family protein [Mycobacterium sp.]|nr:nuclear transport factor 2 family protein [Mycobacterium sp.]
MVHPFRRAIEARDLDAAVALLRDDVVFRSPAVFTPYHGRDALRRILEAVLAVFEDFRYVREIGADIGVGARDHALVFEARVRDKQIEGCDFIQLDDDGAISAFTVMVRPMSGMLALAEAMKAQLASADAK